jgi:glycosyltransferase involved in cell wall biosynthesis
MTSNFTLHFRDVPPPPGKSDWPWTKQDELPLTQLKVVSSLPKISVVTSNYNYGHFLEETIRSVLLQGYPNLEYIIIDGGSTDNSVEIIKKYEKFINYWVSEPDRGQTDALNKGYQKCTGNIFAWLNSDDIYTPTTLWEVAKLYQQGYEMIAGSCKNLFIDRSAEEIIQSHQYSFSRYLRFWSYPPTGFLPQPSVFITKQITDRCFPLDEELYCAMDHQFFLRALTQKPKIICINQVWSVLKYHGSNKTGSEYPVFDEICRVSLKESQRLSKIACYQFCDDLSSYKLLKTYLDKEEGSRNFLKTLLFLFTNPSMIRLQLFWKILFRHFLGDRMYSRLKTVRHDL